MQRERTIAVLGDHGAVLGDLAERVRALGHRTVRAKTLEEAIDFADERNVEYAVAFIEPMGLAYDLAGALQSLRVRANSPHLRFIATGSEPDTEHRELLRHAGVERALFTPIADNALRFQLNAALSGNRQDLLRSDTRAPVVGQATVTAGGRRKLASIYCLSAGGAFLETPRPSMSGARVVVAFQTPDGQLRFDADVLYTNVPGNVSQPKLPLGMAVRFAGVERAAWDSLRAIVTSHARSLSV